MSQKLDPVAREFIGRHQEKMRELFAMFQALKLSELKNPRLAILISEFEKNTACYQTFSMSHMAALEIQIEDLTTKFDEVVTAAAEMKKVMDRFNMNTDDKVDEHPDRDSKGDPEC